MKNYSSAAVIRAAYKRIGFIVFLTCLLQYIPYLWATDLLKYSPKLNDNYV